MHNDEHLTSFRFQFIDVIVTSSRVCFIHLLCLSYTRFFPSISKLYMKEYLPEIEILDFYSKKKGIRDESPLSR